MIAAILRSKYWLVALAIAGLVLTSRIYSLKTKLSSANNTILSLEVSLKLKELESISQTYLAKACIERETNAQKVTQERKQIVNRIEYKPKQEENNENLCNGLTEESRKSIVDRLNRSF